MADLQELQKQAADVRARLKHEDASLESLVQGRKRLQAILDNLRQGEESAAQKKVIGAVRRDVKGFTDRINKLQDERKKQETILRRIKKAIRRWRRRHQGGHIVMFDSIDVSQIPRDAKFAAAGYTSGFWPTWNEIKAGPWSKKLSINVAAGHDGECDDVEPGDFSNSSPGSASKKYTSVSNLPPLWNALKARGIDPNKLLFITAHYDGHEHICDETCGFGLTTEMAARIAGTQWTSTAQGKNLDQSLCELRLFD